MPKKLEHSTQNAPKRLAEKKPMRTATKVVISIIGVFVILLSGGSAWALYSYDLVYPGVHTGVMDAAGMDRETLAFKLNEKNEQLYKGKSIELTIQSSEYTVTTDEINVRIDADKAADAVISYGRTGNYFKRLIDVAGAYIKGASVDVLSFDKQALEKKSNEIADAFIKESKSSDYEIKDDKLILYLKNKNAVLSADAVYNTLLERFRTADFSALKMEPENNQVQEPDLNAICAEIQSEPQNARLDLKKDPLGETIIPHKDGVKIDVEEAKRILKNRGDKTIVEIPVTVTKAQVTTEALQGALFRDVLSEVTTNLNPGLVSRTSNVKLAADYLNGKILNPGDEFSYNKIVGERTLERGFKDAKIFQDGEIIDGLGGGICQVSSTTYMAVLRADLKIAERRNHQFTVSYTPLGQDATVVYGSTDFRFVNNTLYPIRVIAYQKGSSITIKLYGTKTENKEVKLVTTVLEKTPYESRTIVDPSLKANEKVVDSEGHTGYKTVTYRVVYIDGKEVRRELENKSTYKKLDFVTRIGQTDQAVTGTVDGENISGNEAPPDAVVLPEADPVLAPDLDVKEGTDQNNSGQTVY